MTSCARTIAKNCRRRNERGEQHEIRRAEGRELDAAARAEPQRSRTPEKRSTGTRCRVYFSAAVLYASGESVARNWYLRFHDSADSVSFLIVASLLFDRAHEPRRRTRRAPSSLVAASPPAPLWRASASRSCATSRSSASIAAAILLGHRLEAHRLGFAAAQLRELALLLVDVGLQLVDDLRSSFRAPSCRRSISWLFSSPDFCMRARP